MAFGDLAEGVDKPVKDAGYWIILPAIQSRSPVVLAGPVQVRAIA